MDHELCEKVIELSVEVKNLKEKVDNLDGISTALTKMSTILEIQVQDNKDRDKLIGKISESLTSVLQVTAEQSKSLERLNDNIQETNNRLDDMDKRMSEEHKSDSISISEMLKKGFWIGFGVVATGIVYMVIKNLPSYIK